MSNFSLHDLYNYQIPYLIAVELYIIYQKDKDKALNILIKIILHATPYNIFSLLHNNGIILNQHCVKYEKELCFKLGY